jgi:lipopolysaccharide export system permease protein
MIRILDRERYWAFIKAYVICFVSLIGLYIVIDVFANFDEFAQRASGMALLQAMVRYYLVHSSQFYDRLCGIISMMAAIFTVTWMQKNNEHLAMLAAGISTYRVIRPVWVSAIVVSLLAVVNQECIMPVFGEELQRAHKDDGTMRAAVTDHRDSLEIELRGKEADRVRRTIIGFTATIPSTVSGAMRVIKAERARYVPEEAERMPLRGGWLILGAEVTTKSPTDLVEDHVLISLDGRCGLSPRASSWAGAVTSGMYGIVRGTRPTPADFGDTSPYNGSAYFLRSDLTFESVTRSRQWFWFATTKDLLRGVFDPANRRDRDEIKVFLHNRLLRPVMSLVLMFVSLPLVLGGYGRNMFINLGLSLGTSAIFYVASFVAQYLGTSNDLSPELSAWGPLIIFGTFAYSRWDTIRT